MNKKLVFGLAVTAVAIALVAHKKSTPKISGYTVSGRIPNKILEFKIVKSKNNDITTLGDVAFKAWASDTNAITDGITFGNYLTITTEENTLESWERYSGVVVPTAATVRAIMEYKCQQAESEKVDPEALKGNSDLTL